MFPTEPIRRYINLSFAKKIDDAARTYAAEVTAARLKFQGRSGMRIRAIMQPAIGATKARVDSWLQIVREACKEAERPVDNEVREYMLAEVHKMCEASRIHTAQALATTLHQEAMQENPGLREALWAELDRQISQIESEVGRELKIEELKENVQKSAEHTVPRPMKPEASTPAVIPGTDRRTSTSAPEAGKTSHTWTSFEKWTMGFTIVLLLIAVVGLVSNHEFRVWAGIERPKAIPQTEDPKPRLEPPVGPPIAVPAPMPKPGRIAQQNQAKAAGGSNIAQNTEVSKGRSVGSNNVVTVPGPCSNVQIGGQGNTATTNCVPPPRIMSDDTVRQFAAALSSQTGMLKVVLASSSDDVYPLSQQICNAAHAANWGLVCPTSRNSVMGHDAFARGLQCYSDDWRSNDSVAFKRAMTAASLTCNYISHAYDFGGGVQIGGPGGITLVIGSPTPQ